MEVRRIFASRGSMKNPKKNIKVSESNLQSSPIPEGLTGFGVVVALPICAAVLVYFPRYLNPEAFGNSWLAIAQAISIFCYILAGFCLAFTLFGFIFELQKSPQMRAFLNRELRNIFTNPLRSLFNRPTTKEGLENGSIAVLFIGMALTFHVALIVMVGLPSVASFIVKLFVILPLCLIAALAVAATVDSVAIKPILLS